MRDKVNHIFAHRADRSCPLGKWITDVEILLVQIRAACPGMGLAWTNFGRPAVNDGKVVNRLKQGDRIALGTVEHVLVALQKV